ncbi:MAG: cation:proton antiporter [Pseudomonadota bacterium]
MMDFEWVAVALGDVAWIGIAFVLGSVARRVGLPPLIGFLATGFLLQASGMVSGDMLDKLADLGITLLLFTIGLKLNLRTLVRPEVMAVTLLHMGLAIAAFALLLLGLATLGLSMVAGLSLEQALLLGFALSFSSTVFVAKALEERGDMASLHGRIAISILIVQDLVAVVFLAGSTGQWPSPFALILLGLIPLRPLLGRLMEQAGHGELMVLLGLLLALGGAELFEIVGLKGDLGALVIGILVAGHAKAEELSKTMLGFKDLFLLGFFLSIGQAGIPDLTMLGMALLLTPLVLVKSAGFFLLMTAFRLRARTSLLASLNLSNYSEFGLIVAAIGVSNGWIGTEWLVTLALALTLSFTLAAPLSAASNKYYDRHRAGLMRFERERRVPDERPVDLSGARVAIIGMGAVGSGTYDAMVHAVGDHVIGIDTNPEVVRKQQDAGRRMIEGDPSDVDFWLRLTGNTSLELIMLTLPRSQTTQAVIEELRFTGFAGRIAATARYPDQEAGLLNAGATMVFNTATEAGVGFAAHVLDEKVLKRREPDA